MQIIDIRKEKNWQEKVISTLKNDGIVIYPTETCYGIGCDVTNKDSVSKLLKYKKRPEGKAISMVVADVKMAERYVEINKMAKNLYTNFLPGPLTIISKAKKNKNVDSRLKAEDDTLGIRIPDYSEILDLVAKFDKPITATSANASYKKTPYKVSDILNNISDKQKCLIDLVFDAGTLPQNPPSTVIDTTLNEEKILRQGKIKVSHAQSLFSKTSLVSNSEKETKKIAKKCLNDLTEKHLLEKNCLIFSLQGELGAGKTQFAKGVGQALGIKEEVVSPTFNIVREYDFKKGKLIHVDTWRLHHQEDISKYLTDDCFISGNVIVIEWSEKIKDFLVKLNRRDRIKVSWINLEHEDVNKRKISVFGA